MMTKHASQRGTIFVEDAVIDSVTAYPERQFVVRLRAPRCAATATPGSFVHLQCDETIPMRRPLSIMRASPSGGWIEVLFKIVGEGLLALGGRRQGEVVSSMGPIGHGFRPQAGRPRTILVGGGVGIPPMLFLAETLKDDPRWRPVVFMGSEIPFPFDPVSSALDVPGIDGGNAAMPLLESWGVPSRLASLAGFEETFRGYVTDLAATYLDALQPAELAQAEIFACGPTPMLAAVARVAARYDVPCQVSLEEYMACAVGGCAGCTVQVATADGPAMQRVCVDGPVFKASEVFPNS